MSLIEKTMIKFFMVDVITVNPDGEGSINRVYKDGAEFKASATKNDSTEARIGEADGVKNVYTIWTKKDVLLKNADIIKRAKDGKYFLVKSDGIDMETPEGAKLNLRKVSAEEWELPT